MPLCISSLLEESTEETEKSMNFIAKQFTTVGKCDKKPEEVLEMNEKKAATKQQKEDEDIALGSDGRRVSFSLEIT